MAFKPIYIDRERLTFFGVTLPDIDTLNKTANAIGSNMFEGFEPTEKGVEIIRDFILEKITISDLLFIIKEKSYA